MRIGKAKRNVTNRKSRKLPLPSKKRSSRFMQYEKRQCPAKRIRSQSEPQEQYERTFARADKSLISIQSDHAHLTKIPSPSNGQEQCKTTLTGSKLTVAQVSCLSQQYSFLFGLRVVQPRQLWSVSLELPSFPIRSF